MPTSTFDKLKPEKKARFLEFALQEFANNTYENASVTRIGQNLAIAKGSIYQYFAHKKDLYFYLIDYANRQRQAAIGQVLKRSFSDFFAMYEQVYLAGTQFDLANPILSRFLHNVAQERFSADLGNLHQLTLKQSIEYFKNLLKNEQSKGNIRQDVKVETMAFWVVQIGSGILDFVQLNNLTEEADLRIFFGEIKEILTNGMQTSKI
ncbi:MAG: TetR/AcrR family transcriptional regulator [Microscillaceae bacterium]|jgi:AcrR family transcriptional regulator|nr:TetR/AcrR family transcriptional regulator [Microscillaceae bacterium]